MPNSFSIEVQNVEVSERIGKHIAVWARHSDGDRAFRYVLDGRHDLEPETVYRIEYVNRVKIL